jgi:hypothetical protein
METDDITKLNVDFEKLRDNVNFRITNNTSYALENLRSYVRNPVEKSSVIGSLDNVTKQQYTNELNVINDLAQLWNGIKTLNNGIKDWLNLNPKDENKPYSYNS